jgi:hypothetical protein
MLRMRPSDANGRHPAGLAATCGESVDLGRHPGGLAAICGESMSAGATVGQLNQETTHTKKRRRTSPKGMSGAAAYF